VIRDGERAAGVVRHHRGSRRPSDHRTDDHCRSFLRRTSRLLGTSGIAILPAQLGTSGIVIDAMQVRLGVGPWLLPALQAYAIPELDWMATTPAGASGSVTPAALTLLVAALLGRAWRLGGGGHRCALLALLGRLRSSAPGGGNLGAVLGEGLAGERHAVLLDDVRLRLG
jgi:hypothetical protein